MSTYVAKPLPKAPEIQREFQHIAESLRTVNDFEVLNSLPQKAREGMVRYFAAGVAGAAKGLYYYDGAAWITMNASSGNWWEHISSVTASQDSSLNITGLTGYDLYMLEFENLRGDDASPGSMHFTMQVGTGTSFYSGSAYSFSAWGINENLDTADSAETATQWVVIGDSDSGAGDPQRYRPYEDFNISGQLQLFDLGAAAYTGFMCHTNYTSYLAANNAGRTMANGIVKEATARNSVKLTGSGLTFSGTVHAYGRNHPA